MAWTDVQGLSFRSSVAFVTDPAGTACVTSGDDSLPTYPLSVSPNGATFNTGWYATGLADGERNRNAMSGTDSKLSGCAFADGNLSGIRTLSIALPSAGTYKIWISLGDYYNSGTYGAGNGIYDGGTVGQAYTSGGEVKLADFDFGGTTGDNYYDATGNLLSRTNWSASNSGAGGGTPIQCVFSTSVCKLALVYTSGTAYVTHLAIQKVTDPLTASDDFAYVTSDLAPINATNWATLQGNLESNYSQRGSMSTHGTTNNISLGAIAVWKPISSINQYAEFKCLGLGQSGLGSIGYDLQDSPPSLRNHIGIVLRQMGTWASGTCYYVLLDAWRSTADPGTNLWALRIVKRISGSDTTLYSNDNLPASTFSVNSVIKASIVGTTITVYVDGSQLYQLTDSSISTPGRFGFMIGHHEDCGYLDNFTGGDVASGPSITSLSKSTFAPGESVTITGSGFGASQGSGKVYISQ